MAQDSSLESWNDNRKGDIYFYWGWNRCAHSASNIRFKGEHYDFTLRKVSASDRQTPFNIGTHLNPSKATIPQYNFRIGYFFHRRYSLSFGVDHMKYVVDQFQKVRLTGEIRDEIALTILQYNDEDVIITEDFLQFEHTDGLNFIHVGIQKDIPFKLFDRLFIKFTQGIDVGAMLPRTNTSLLNKKRYDQFHLSGYGVGGMIGLQVHYYKSLFIRSEFKGGFINMPDIRTTEQTVDRASQHFFFSQINVLFGARIGL